MSRPALLTRMYVLVLLRHEGRYLLVHERKHGQTWYLPAGAVEPGEDLVAAAIRETLEEGGVRPRIRGIVKLEHEWRPEPGASPTARLRCVFFADALGPTVPKRVADRHTLEARWVAPHELGALPLRHPEVVWLVDAVERGAPVLPISAYEGESFGSPAWAARSD